MIRAFDFTILADCHLYLGESKWQRSSEKVVGGELVLRPEQLLRHQLFQFYVREWAFGSYTSWSQFEMAALTKLKSMGISKPIAPAGSLLAANLQTVLGVVRRHYPRGVPEVCNVLLYLHGGLKAGELPSKASEGFSVVALDYGEVATENFIRLSV